MKRRLFKNSAILNGLGRIADGLYDAMAKSATGRTLTSYDNERVGARSSLVVTKLSSVYRNIKVKSAKRFVARGIENSLFCEKVRSFFDSVLNTSLHSLGIFFLAFGFYGVLMFLLTNYAIDRLPAVPLTYLYVDVAVMLLSLPLTVLRKSLYKAVTESRLCNIFLFGLLGIRRERSDSALNQKGFASSTAFIIGTFFGITTLVFPPFTVLNFFFTVAAGYVILISPESGVVLTALLRPFVPSDFLGYLMIYIIISHYVKLVRGKRTLSLDLKDYAVLFFGAVIFLGGVFSIDKLSFTYSIKLLSFVFAYIVTVNLIRSRKWLERLKSAFILSVIIAAIFGIVDYITITSTHYLSEKSILGNEVSAFFDSSSVLALYLAVGFFFVIAELINNDNAIRKLFMLLMSAAVAVCLYLTDQPIVLLMTLIAAALFFLIYSNRTIYLLLLSSLVLPVSRFIVPMSINAEYERLASIASEQITQRLPIWQTSLYMMNDYLFSGCGVGSYRMLFSSYANETLGSATDSSNLYIQTIIDTGIFGLAVFLIVVFFFIQHSFGVFATEGGGKRNIYTAAGVAGVITLLLCGFVFHLWSDTRIFLCMWMVMGISTSAGKLRLSERAGLNAYIN